VAAPQSNAADETRPTSDKPASTVEKQANAQNALDGMPMGQAASAAQAAEPDTIPATLPHNEVNTSKAAVPVPQAAPATPTHTKSMLWLALVSLVAVTVVVGWLWKSHGTPTITETSAQAGFAAVAASAAHASTATAAVNSVAESAPAAPIAAVANPAPVAMVSAPKNSTLAPHSAASAKHPNTHEAVTHPQHSNAANHTAAPAVEPAAPPPAEPVPAHNPAPRPKDHHAAGPKEACESRNFFTQSACVYEQCTRPAFHDHPYCIQLRERQDKSRLGN
jgi:hypothetical protein